MRPAVGVGAVLGLVLSRMAYLVLAVPEKNCADTCPADPSFWPWAVAGALVGAAVLVLMRIWLLRLRCAEVAA